MSVISLLRAEISERHRQIAVIQEACSHPEPCLTKKYEGSTGNYDPSDDCYWVVYECSLCEKRWSEEQ
jgi:hypothetical protein